MSENKIHWKSLMNPDYLGAWAIQPGDEPVLTITSVKTEKVVGSDGKKEECPVMYYKGIGPGKMILNVTNSRTIEKLSGSPFVGDWAGLRVQVYVERVKAFGGVCDAVRIRPFKPKAAAPVPKCSECGNEIQAAFGKSPAALAAYTEKQYGKPMCADCAQKVAAAAPSEPTEGEGSTE